MQRIWDTPPTASTSSARQSAYTAFPDDPEAQSLVLNSKGKHRADRTDDDDSDESTDGDSEGSRGSASSSSCRKGAGYNDASLTTNLKICWAYNWASAQGTPALADGVEYIPMLWGSSSTYTGSWSDNAKSGIAAGAGYLLAFNEPDLSSQSNMAVADAVTAWNTYMEPFKGDAKLVSPAVTNGVGTTDAPQGVPWLQQFIAQCSGCQIDAVALHWYDSNTNIDYFTSYFTDAYSTLQKPIWITEFAGTPEDVDAQATFLNTVIPWIEKQTFIERYAGFGAFSDNSVCNYVNSDGSLNAVGTVYAAGT
ncbi:Glycoside hydrolase [Pseudohyphozyma bogoriensis]|nr:Glycoside hydrolase [Pseudohyphozyma bogoriensis]